MSKPKIVKYAVFEIDVDKDSYTKVDLTSINDNHLSQFILNLATDTTTNNSSRKAIFNSSSYAKIAMEELAKENSTVKLDELARQLLVTEKSYNQKIKQLNNSIRPGSLIIAKVERSSDSFILMAKIEFSNYLARKSFLLQAGLPQEKSLTRTCLIKISNNALEKDIVLAGSNGSIPAYWHAGFVQATFTRNNSENTDQAFKLIESKMSFVKEASKEDYVDLRDCLIGYFKGNKQFNFDDIIKTLTENFEPESKNVDLSKLAKKLKSLKEQDKFDGSFEIDKSQIKARLRKNYSLGNDIILTANSATGKIFQTTKSSKNYVVIESEKVLSDFKTKSF